MVAAIAGCEQDVAAEALASADGDVKVATLIACRVDVDAAKALLDKHGRNLRSAMAEIPHPPA
jgi:N-acetylmuramic acid 6-phosphate etherase